MSPNNPARTPPSSDPRRDPDETPRRVMHWEGGVRVVGFVRGTNSALAPVQAGAVRTNLMHAADWFATVCGLAGVPATSRYPLDGFDQWLAISEGAPSPRTAIVHNAPVVATPVLVNGTWSTSSCMSAVDPAVSSFGGCHAFGVTGIALRVGDYKLLTTFNGSAPWGDNTVRGVPQYTPLDFKPTTNDSVPEPHLGVFYLFNIAKDASTVHTLQGQGPPATFSSRTLIIHIIPIPPLLTADRDDKPGGVNAGQAAGAARFLRGLRCHCRARSVVAMGIYGSNMAAQRGLPGTLQWQFLLFVRARARMLCSRRGPRRRRHHHSGRQLARGLPRAVCCSRAVLFLRVPRSRESLPPQERTRRRVRVR